MTATTPETTVETLPYKNPDLPASERIADLLSRMTLEEKVGQMMQLDARGGDLDELIVNKHVGSILHTSPEDLPRAVETVNTKTRLGIPLVIGDDCIHGYSFWPGATIFPSQLGMALSWDPKAVEAAGRATAEEVSSTGVHWTFSPVLCIARDTRWGRVDETFGEDPMLIGEMASAMVKGYQGGAQAGETLPKDAILACAKHFAGYSETQGGRDASEADLSHRKLESWFLPPFERIAKEGCGTFMLGYESIEGVPVTFNKWLLTDKLRGAWKYNGTLITDEVARKLKEAGACSMGISIDSLDAAKHDAFRGVAGAHADTLAGIEACKRAGLDFQIHTTVVDWNRDEVCDITDFAQSIGAVNHSIFFLIPVGRGKYIEETSLKVLENEALLQDIMRKAAEVDIDVKPTCAPQFTRVADQLGIPTRYTRGCLAGLTYCVVGSEGIVRPCAYMTEDAGDVREQPFDEIWATSPGVRAPAHAGLRRQLRRVRPQGALRRLQGARGVLSRRRLHGPGRLLRLRAETRLQGRLGESPTAVPCPAAAMTGAGADSKCDGCDGRMIGRPHQMRRTT